MPVGTGVSDVRRTREKTVVADYFCPYDLALPSAYRRDQEMMQEKMMDDSMMMEKGKIEMPKTGTPATLSMLLPAAVTLLRGSGVLTYAVVRRR